MAIPAAALAAEAEANEALEALSQGDEADEEAVDAPTSPEPDAIPDTVPPVEPDPVEVEEEEPEAPAEEPVVEETVSEEAARLQKAEQRYKTLQGKYNAETRKLRDETLMLQGRLQALESQPPAPLAPAAPQAPEAPLGPPQTRYLKPEEAEEYAPEVLDIQARVAKGVAEDLLAERLGDVKAERAALEARLAQLERQNSANAGASLWDRVEQAFPGAKEINESDPLWPEFLNTVEPLSGLRYRDIGASAIDSGDIGRVVTLMSLYSEGGAARESAAGDDTPTSPAAKPRAVRGVGSVTKAKPIPKITAAHVRSFYEDVARGRYEGRDKARDAREKEIELAASEGRIVSG